MEDKFQWNPALIKNLALKKKNVALLFGGPSILKSVVVSWDGPLSGFELTWMFT